MLNIPIVTREKLVKERPVATFREGFDINDHIRLVKDQGGQTVAEFIGTGNFANDFFKRQQYEVEAGRDMEPIIYDRIYQPQVNSAFPRLVEIDTLNDAGVVFEEVKEGGEVKFASVTSGSKSIRMRHWASGIEYNEDLIIYNELWRLPNIERQFGVAYNALQNHIHLSPLLTASYSGNNATDGTALTSFKVSDDLALKYLRALEAAITAASTDTSNPRRGPYILLVSSSDVFTWERALNRVSQQGIDLQTSAISRVNEVVAYDGWSGTRGKKATTYSGVSAGTSYLVNLGYRMWDFQSLWKQPLRRQRGDGDLSRFIVEQVIWDTRFGVYANPTGAVHEITLPVAASGAS